ncbi:hypothetical protein L1987_85096 [Smallanthus sonchifolius]|uniref:Uncharacterized protein n=1 Tax=Smallanthus sonchifolius TaxID=185202 RepID=A0ACB8XW61_9ASTR|nr:hypothetical protein L1987_85096 [Smallanthus sonchifolius]
MEEAGASSGVASSSLSTLLSGGGRLRFEVELTPGETTIVSWKKLMKDANKVVKNKNDNEVPHLVAGNASVVEEVYEEMLLKMKQMMHPW